MSETRRGFLAAAAATAEAARAWQGSPNDRIRLGQIGCGGRSKDHLMELRRSGENAAIVAVCDVWKVNRQASVAAIEQAFGTWPRETTRYQDLLAMKDIDAVLIATPDMTIRAFWQTRLRQVRTFTSRNRLPWSLQMQRWRGSR
jgi:hypothetical protein